MAITVRGLAKAFGATRALAGIDLDVPAGSIVGLLGPNGAGKTTAVRIITTLLAPDAGIVEVLGHDVLQDPTQVRRMIGLAGQSAAVDDTLTGEENLSMIGRLSHMPGNEVTARARSLLERFRLDDAGDRQVKTYSGGMRRRLDLAASLVANPPVLLLDEPTTGLDPRSRIDLWEVIRDLVDDGGTTVLLTTQYLEEADELCDDIVVIDHGLVIAQGTSAALKRQLGGEVVELALADRTEIGAATAALGKIGEVHIDDHDARFTIQTEDPIATMLLAGQRLRRKKIGVAELAVRQPTLDEVFLALTDGAQAPAPEPAASLPAAPAPRARRSMSREERRHAVADTLVMAWRNLIRYRRLPQLLAFSTIQPAMFVVLFRYVFGGAIPSGINYADYLVPGILVQSVLFGASQTAVGLAEDLSSGAIERFRSLPMARSAVLAGRTTADAARNILVITIITAVGYGVGFRITSFPGFAAAVAIALLFGLALSWVEAWIGLAIGDAEAALPASFVWLFPLMFASSMFVPTATMPSWLQHFANANPVSHTVNAVRALVVGAGPASTDVLTSLAWAMGILVVAVPLAVRRYRKTV